MYSCTPVHVYNTLHSFFFTSSIFMLSVVNYTARVVRVVVGCTSNNPYVYLIDLGMNVAKMIKSAFCIHLLYHARVRECMGDFYIAAFIPA